MWRSSTKLDWRDESLNITTYSRFHVIADTYPCLADGRLDFCETLREWDSYIQRTQNTAVEILFFFLSLVTFRHRWWIENVFPKKFLVNVVNKQYPKAYFRTMATWSVLLYIYKDGLTNFIRLLSSLMRIRASLNLLSIRVSMAVDESYCWRRLVRSMYADI